LITPADPGTTGLEAHYEFEGNTNDRYFNGSIDDARIYDRALMPEEAAWLGGRTKPFDKPF